MALRFRILTRYVSINMCVKLLTGADTSKKYMLGLHNHKKTSMQKM